MGNTTSFVKIRELSEAEAVSLIYNPSSNVQLTVVRNQSIELLVQDNEDFENNAGENKDHWVERWIVSDGELKSVESPLEKRVVIKPTSVLCLEIVNTSSILFLPPIDVLSPASGNIDEMKYSSSSSVAAETVLQVNSLPTTPIIRKIVRMDSIDIDSSEELERELLDAPTLPLPRNLPLQKGSGIILDDSKSKQDTVDERSDSSLSDAIAIPDSFFHKQSDRRSSIMSFTYFKQPKVLTHVEAMSVGGISRLFSDEVIHENTELSTNSALRKEEYNLDEKDNKSEVGWMKTVSMYEVCEPVVLLGTGRYGQVLKVEDKKHNFFAQKIINKEHLTDEVAKMQFMAEVSVLLRCKHSNLVRMYEQAETEEAYLITLELCLGSARTFFKDTIPLSERHTQFLVGQVIQGVDYLHRQGIMHRDLKLGNILMASPFHLKLADFGLSKVFNSSTGAKQPKLVRTSTNVGTQFMKAPEQLAMVPYSFKVDCWAIGIITWQFMIGGMPFLLRSKQQVKRALRSFRIPHRVSDEGTDFIERLLKLKEEDRASPFKALTHPFIFNPPELTELQKAWSLPYDANRVDMLHKQQLTPREYISLYNLAAEESNSDSSTDDLIHFSNV